MQREDLTPYETAQGFQLILDLGNSVKEIAKKTGFTQTTVKHSLEIAKLDGEAVMKGVEHGATLADFIELEKIQDPETKAELLLLIGGVNFHYRVKEAADKEEAKRNKKRIMSIVSLVCEKATFPVWQYGRLGSIYFKDNVKSSDVVLPDGAMYFSEGSSSVEILGDRQEEYKNKQEVDTSAEEERRANYERRKEELAAINKRMLALRLEFIGDYGKAELNKHKDLVIEVASISLADSRRVDNDIVCALMGLGEDESDDRFSRYQAAAWFLENGGGTALFKLFIMTYAALDDTTKTWHSTTYYGTEIQPRRGDFEGDALYAFLRALGYEMSEEEMSIVGGSHPLYDKPEPEEDGGEEQGDE
jgi:ParB family chromosome partitioning protein